MPVPLPTRSPTTHSPITISPPMPLAHVPSMWTVLWQSLVVLSAFFVGQLAGVALVTPWILPTLQGASIGDKVLAGSNHGTIMVWAILLTLLLVSVVAVVLVRLQHNRVTQYLALRGFSWGALLRCGVMLILLNVLINAISSWLNRDPMVFMDTLAASAQPFWLLALGMVVAAPIYEELIFRGFMWTGFANTRVGVWGASLITSVIFAFIHFQYGWIEAVSIVALAMLFSYARMMSGSLLLPIGLHIANNGLAMWQYVAMH